MRTKKIAILGAALFVIFVFAVGSLNAAEWPIQGTVVQTGMYDDKAYVVIKDTLDNYWAAFAISTSEKEILATALTGYSMSSMVQGTYDTETSEWVDLFCYTP